jgi:hypothetical protein
MSSVNTKIIPIAEPGINSLVLMLVLPKEDVLTATALGIHLPHPDTKPATDHPPTYPEVTCCEVTIQISEFSSYSNN